MNAYQQLEQRFKRLSLLIQSIGMLQWDAATMMPSGSANERSEQIAVLKVMAHELMADPMMGDLLGRAESDKAGLDDWQQANLGLMRREWLHSTAVPAKLVDALSRAGSTCEIIWRQARKNDDFSMLEFPLENVLKLTREVAAVKAEALGCDPYDALLDQFEPGGKSADIDLIFDDLAEFLPEFIQQVLDKQASMGPPKPLDGHFSEEAQRKLGMSLMDALGFSFENGRLDSSAHPFCGGTPDDIRITTAYRTDNFLTGMMAVLHETGHALYEQGLPAQWKYQPVGASQGMSIHESQSLAVEMQVCRTPEFAQFVAPILRDTLGVSGPQWDAENIYRHFIDVERGLIRVYADEATYPAHVIFRYRLEKAMINGELQVADLPQAWAESMQELLGVRPPNDKDGCMQDIHWMDGLFGYFPTYSLGAMTAAQLFDAAVEANPSMVADFSSGNFDAFLGWMRTNVHGLGSRHNSSELLKRATGKTLDAECYKKHLQNRYLG